MWRSCEGPSVHGVTDAFVPPPQHQQPPGAWAPAPVTPRQGTNGWAITSLVTGLLGIFFVALPAGVAGLLQTRRHQQAGEGLAVAGVVLGGLTTALVSAVIGFGVAGAFDPEPLGTLNDAPTTTVGTCLRERGAWQVIDCSSPHDGEVYAVEPASGTVYGGADDLFDEADDLCYDAFEDYTGEDYDTSDYDYAFFLPSRAEWDAGRTEVVCVLTPFLDDELVGSAR